MVAAKKFRYISNLETNNSSSRSKGKPFGSMMISIVTCKKSKKTNVDVFVLRKKTNGASMQMQMTDKANMTWRLA